MSSKRLGFFTRLLDQGSAQQRYRLATEQIVHAERVGFDSAWVAQHHFHEDEGGLPSPWCSWLRWRHELAISGWVPG